MSKTKHKSVPRTLPLKCPACGRAVRPVPFMQNATIVRKRTCRGCRFTWRVLIRPKTVKLGWVHEITWRAHNLDDRDAKLRAEGAAHLSDAILSKPSLRSAKATGGTDA